MSTPMNVTLSAVVDVLAQRYSGAAAITLVVYDIIITMDKEIQHFWGRSFSPVQLIYFLNRYYGLVVVMIYIYGDMIQIFSDDLCMFDCKRIVQFGAWTGWTMILLADAIMAIRVHALFERTRIATIFLGSLYFAQGAAMMGMLIAYVRRFDDFAWHEIQACGTIAPSWFSVFWIPTLVFEFILLGMTLYKTMQYNTVVCKSGTYKRYSLYRILVRDQVIYFVSILLSGCANIALWSGLPPGMPNNETINLSVAIPCVLGGRILIALRDAASQQEECLLESETDVSELVL